ncbi:MAG: addiction module antitoxin RelB [Omnitrophica bacterium RIFOXYB12_FULL_50_7]|nr:MAG: addiction module antitoxin RelB [Omnitrophica bacterium RIFOXYB12_FULL_50_7]
MEPHFEILYHPDVPQKDLPRISGVDRSRICRAIEQKLAFFPHEFGAPLRHTLKGYWKLRVGDWRVIYKIQGKTLTILRIGRRREIYGT